MFSSFKYWFVIFLLVCAFPSNAQTNNFWRVDHENGAYFDKQGNIQLYNTPLNTSPIPHFNTYGISNWQGEPLLYFNGQHFRILPNNIEIQNSGFENFTINSLGSGMSHSLVSTYDTSKYIILHHNQAINYPLFLNSNHQPIYSLMYSCIERNNNTASGLEMPNSLKNKEIEQNQIHIGYAATRDSTGQPVIVNRTYNGFSAYKMLRGGEMQKLDTFQDFLFKYSPDTIIQNNGRIAAQFQTGARFSNPVLNHAGNKIVYATNYTTSHRGLILENYVVITMLDFDKHTGSFSNPQIIYQHFFNHFIQNPEREYIDPFNFQFSPNDEFLYIYSYNNEYLNEVLEKRIVLNNFYTRKGKSMYQIDLKKPNINLTKLTDIISTVNRYELMLTNHLGEIYFTEPLDENINGFVLNKISNPNKAAAELEIVKNIPNPIYQNNNLDRSFSHLFDFIRIEQQLSYSCSASVRLRNTSLPDIGFTKFKWHIRDQNDSLLVFEQFEPPVLSFTQNGNYPIQLFAQSPKGGGYGEWYVDTIRVRIPNKPIANFASDTQVCQFLPLSFQNLSIDQTTHTPRPANYLWDFGDGNTSTLANPSHTYTRPGKFTVSLNFKNGYCDSTLSRELYIHVVDAPKPGFTVSDTFGCAPFQVSIGDTSWHNVQSKEYWFSDTAAWQNIPANNSLFYHTFTQPGYYKIVQKLLGLSGCEIRTDSVWINVAPGIKPNDSTHIHLATVQHPTVFVNWKSHPAAVSYTLLAGKTLQSLQPIATTSDTFYSHSTTEPLFYKVTASDSCQNQSSEGRYAYPAWLQGKVLGNNDSAQLTLNSYAIWPASSIQYSLQKWNQEQWQSLQTQNSIFEYYDNNFVIKDSLRSCYRIEVSDAQLADLKAYSNILCLEYLPLIFIPNAFSPNGDGINDILDLNQTGIKSYNLQIYNRWGQKIFDGTNQGWNGQVNGTPASQGIYMVYLIYQTPDGQSYQKSGTVQLIR
jgi:gliding motility-associated-like protein